MKCEKCGNESRDDVTNYMSRQVNSSCLQGRTCNHWYCKKCKHSWVVVEDEEEATAFNFRR